MLGLSNNLSRSRANDKSAIPRVASNIIGWWDFTDKNQVFTDVEGTTHPTDGDDIERVNNLAFTLDAFRDNKKSCLGHYLAQDDDAARKPHWDETNNCVDFTGGSVLYSNPSNGPIDTNKLTISSVDMDAVTIFAVLKPDSASISSDERVIELHGSTGNLISLRLESDDNHFELYTYNGPGRAASTNDTTQDSTTNKQLWTLELDSTSACSVYRDGNTSNGITNAASYSNTMNLTTNNSLNKFVVGATTSALFGFNGKFYEILVFNEAMSDIEISLVESYLKSKHNIS